VRVSDPGSRAVAAAGLAVLVALGWVVSTARRRFPWRTVAWGVALQLALGALLLRTGVGRGFFVGVNAGVAGLLGFAREGTRFVFGSLLDVGPSFALAVFPIIVFMGSLFSVLYHLGVMQRVVRALAAALSRAMAISGAEGVAAVSNVFLGMAESALLVRPYLERMTRSELFVVMNTGMASVAGSVLLAYVEMLGGGDFAGHLVTASLLSAPAGILVAKVMVPETQTPMTGAEARVEVGHESVNLIDAAAMGALAGLRIAAYVGALLVAFVALVALLNAGLGALGRFAGLEGLTFQWLLGQAFAPLAWLMGIPWSEAARVGELLGLKTVLNEFIAYGELGEQLRSGAISPRSAVIASYALCGFANFGSLAILVGALGGMAPGRRPDVARLGLRSILGGTLATMMTGCVAAVFL
jgi:CNT family concentrative nucleoside transporter